MSTAQRRAREKALRKKTILTAARDVFFEEGISQATVDDVAARAEVSKGTIYLYFPGKESLLAHLLLDGLSLLLRNLRRAHRDSLDVSSDAQLQALAQTYLRFSQRQPNYFRLIMAFDGGRFQDQISAELSQRILSRSNCCLGLVSRVIEKGLAEGQFVALDPWLSAGILWAGLNGVLVLYASPVRQTLLKVDLDTMFRETLHVLLAGLHRRDSASESESDIISQTLELRFHRSLSESGGIAK